MKLDIRMEYGKPIIFWLDNPDDDPWEITAYGLHCEHVSACRAYMRKLKKPETPEDIQSCFKVLKYWASI